MRKRDRAVIAPAHNLLRGDNVGPSLEWGRIIYCWVRGRCPDQIPAERFAYPRHRINTDPCSIEIFGLESNNTVCSIELENFELRTRNGSSKHMSDYDTEIDIAK